MSRYIDADPLIMEIDMTEDLSAHDAIVFEEMVNEQPTADVRENVRGEWVPVTNGRGGHECNKCHTYAPSHQSGDEYLSKYCPNCGADMRELVNESQELVKEVNHEYVN